MTSAAHQARPRCSSAVGGRSPSPAPSLSPSPSPSPSPAPSVGPSPGAGAGASVGRSPCPSMATSAHARNSSCGPQPTASVPFSQRPQLLPATYRHCNTRDGHSDPLHSRSRGVCLMSESVSPFTVRSERVIEDWEFVI
ncbi:Protein of unknown function [Gryllus bimaculatus]|nr:Protein of unknown function [Gryllus bimaculatus]